MTNSNHIYATTDWHVCFCGVAPADFADYPDDSFGRKTGYTYQYDASNDEYHSILRHQEAASLLEQVKAGRKLDPWRLQHFTDAHLAILVELMKCDWSAVIDADLQEAMALTAYKHIAEYDNLAVATLILAHLYHMGLGTNDITSFVEEVEEITDNKAFRPLLRAAKKMSEKLAKD